MQKSDGQYSEEERALDALDALKSLILDTDRVENEQQYLELKSKIDDRLIDIESQLNDPQRFAQKLEKSRSYVIDVLAPVIFKIIRKGIKIEMQKMNQGAKNGVLNTKEKLLSVFRLGKKKKAIKLHSEIEEVFLVEKESGILIANYSKEKNANADVIAGMFTAIKTFAETVYQGSKDLNSIEYDDYTIQLFEFGTIYYAIVFSGVLCPEKIDFVTEKVNDFTLEKFNPVRGQLQESTAQNAFEESFVHYFKNIN